MVHFIYYIYIVCLSLDMCTAQAGFDGDSVYDETHTASLLMKECIGEPHLLMNN